MIKVNIYKTIQQLKSMITYITLWLQGIYNHQLGRNLRYDEELVVPIIENTPHERDLEERMHETILAYPGTTAILVRRHGIYVWGDTWQKAKTQ